MILYARVCRYSWPMIQAISLTSRTKKHTHSYRFRFAAFASPYIDRPKPRFFDKIVDTYSTSTNQTLTHVKSKPDRLEKNLGNQDGWRNDELVWVINHLVQAGPSHKYTLQTEATAAARNAARTNPIRTYYSSANYQPFCRLYIRQVAKHYRQRPQQPVDAI